MGAGEPDFALQTWEKWRDWAPRLGPALRRGDLVGLLSEESTARGLCDKAWVWHCLVAMETNRAGRGARSKDGNTLRLGHPLLAEASSSSSTTFGANCLCNGIVDTEAQRRGLTCPKSYSKTCPEPRTFNFHRLPLTSPDSLDLQTPIRNGLWTEARRSHCLVPMEGRIRPQHLQDTNSGFQEWRVICWVLLRSHLRYPGPTPRYFYVIGLGYNLDMEGCLMA